MVPKSGPADVDSGFGSVKRLDTAVGGRQLLRLDTQVTVRNLFHSATCAQPEHACAQQAESGGYGRAADLRDCRRRIRY